MYGIYPYIPHPHTNTASPLTSITPRVVHLLQWINLHLHNHLGSPQHNHLEFTDYITVLSMDQDTRIMTCIHHFDIMHDVFTTLKVLWALPSPLTPGNHRSFYCLHSFTFSRMSLCWDHKSMQPFQIGFFHLVICVLVFSMSFHGIFSF